MFAEKIRRLISALLAAPYRKPVTFLAMALLPAAAFAQAASMQPPALKEFVKADYPAAAREAGREAAVELVLVVGTDGRVQRADVAAPVGEGFDEAALAAARAFTFTPAMKDGSPIAARIRYRYVFELAALAPVTGALEGRVLTAADAPLAGADVVVTAPGGEVLRAVTGSAGTFAFPAVPPGAYAIHVSALDHGDASGSEAVIAGEATAITWRLEPVETGDVLSFGAVARVEAPPREVVRRTLAAEETGRIAGTRGDALRAVELLPGVGRPPSGQGMILVRGSSPWDSEVYFEGVPVYNLYHFGGLTSFVNSRLLDQIDLYPGNYSARFGGKNGGVVEVGLRDPKSDRVQGYVDVNPVDGAMIVEGPLSQTVSFAIAGRRSFLDFFFDAVLGDDESMSVTTAPVYEDYQAIAAWKPNDRDKVRFIAYRSSDVVKLRFAKPSDDDPAIRGGIGQEQIYNRFQTQWTRRWSPELEQEISATGGTSVLGFKLGDAQLQFDLLDSFGRAEWRWRPHGPVQVIGGFDLHRSVFKGTYIGPRATAPDGDPSGRGPLATQQQSSVSVEAYEMFHSGAFVESIVTPVAPLQLVLGGRVQHYSEIDETSLEPRMSARWTFGTGTTLKAGAGMFSQGPQPGESVEDVGNPDLEPVYAQHYGAGAEQSIGGLTFGAEGFYKRLTNTVVGGRDPSGPGIVNGGTGRIYGLELSGKYSDGRLFSIVSYTLSRSERNDYGDEWRLYDFDQTHNLSATAGWKLGRGWEVGGSVRLVSGTPYTPVTGSFYNADVDLYQPLYGDVNSERAAFTKRVDIRVEKTWQTRNNRSVAAYVDVQNALNERPAEGRSYNYDYSKSQVSMGLPVIPSVGIRAEF